MFCEGSYDMPFPTNNVNQYCHVTYCNSPGTDDFNVSDEDEYCVDTAVIIIIY